MKKNSKLVKASAWIIGVSMVLAGCGSETGTAQTEESHVVVDVMQVEKGTLTLSNQFVGTVAPQESVYIIPMAQGQVTATYKEVGDTVQAGDLLFEIDDTAAQMQLKQAQLTYKNTKAQVDTSWDSATSQKESTVEQLEMQLTATLAQVQGAQTQYFTLKDSVDKGNEALGAMKEQRDSIDEMSTDEVLALAESYASAMMSSSAGMSSGIDIQGVLGSLLGGSSNGSAGGSTGGNVGNGSGGAPENAGMSQAEKDALANQLRPELKAMLDSQIKETENGLWQAQMSLNTAETSMRAAEENYKMMQDSIETAKNTSLEDTKKQLDNSLDLAKLGVESAELALSYYDVTSPISGTVISKGVTVNGFATGSQPSYIIANNEAMTVTFFVSESVKNTLENGAALEVERNGMVFEGAVTEVGNAVNQQTGLFQVKGMVYATGEELPSGVSVKLKVETYRAENAFIIPYDAVYYESDGAYVYVMKDGRAAKTVVTTGIFDDANIEITEGLYLEDQVITSWSPRLIDGALVQASTSDINGK